MSKDTLRPSLEKKLKKLKCYQGKEKYNLHQKWYPKILYVRIFVIQHAKPGSSR